MDIIFFLVAAAIGALVHAAWAAMGEPESLDLDEALDRAAALREAAYTAHRRGLIRGRQLSVADAWDGSKVNGICQRYLVEAGLDAPSADIDNEQLLGI